MGQVASSPQKGVEFQVIGAGLPRTGTTSLSAALEILLNGPVYHSGTQVLRGSERHPKTWMKIFSHTPIKNAEDKREIMRGLSSLLEGYVAATDVHPAIFTPELMELFPTAKVVCGVRDMEPWAKSMEDTNKLTFGWWLWLVLLPLPTIRHFVKLNDTAAKGRAKEILGRPGGRRDSVDWPMVWDQHSTWLKKIVPEEKLIFFDCRDGWEPLCAALGKEVPKGVPFPKLNESKAVEEFAKNQILKGLMAWAALIGTLSFLAAWTLL
ncbi:MAG: hypothetical protein M1820_007944 [Bogoriella megaspora]|nr:MAG: hypothetical protein M1820_007944 [Bogoriella megaspora]